jgi:hypothetical protein
MFLSLRSRWNDPARVRRRQPFSNR